MADRPVSAADVDHLTRGYRRRVAGAADRVPSRGGRAQRHAVGVQLEAQVRSVTRIVLGREGDRRIPGWKLVILAHHRRVVGCGGEHVRRCRRRPGRRRCRDPLSAGAARHHAVGIDRFSPPPIYGFDPGGTRITVRRSARARPTPRWVPALARDWRELEAETGSEPAHDAAGLISSRAGGGAATTVTSSWASTIGLREPVGDQAPSCSAPPTWAGRFPQFGLDGDESAFYEPTAGFCPSRTLASRRQLTVAGRLRRRDSP